MIKTERTNMTEDELICIKAAIADAVRKNDGTCHVTVAKGTDALIAEVRRLNDELIYLDAVLGEADDYARKLMELVKKHFPGIDPGLLKEADAQIGETLSKLRIGNSHARL
jgi:hypothetical protein